MNLTRWISTLALAAVAVAVMPDVADARRLGGGGSAGMRRDLPPRSAPDSLPAKPAQPTPGQNQAAPGAAAGTAAAAAAPARRSWMAPLAGLAAGLGIAALASSLGFGPALANFMTMALLLLVGFIAVRWLMRRFAGTPASPRLATPRGPTLAERDAGPTWTERAQPGAPLAAAPVASSTPNSTLPADFDAAAFERVAKMIFIRMQTANDAGDLNDLRRFTTPEMFAAARLDLQERAGAPQRTDVVRIDAEVLDVAQDETQQIVSVRFHGLVREEQQAGAEPFDEVWHLVKPKDGSREWAIAGIQQSALA